jgi:hypothetical protein
VSRQEWTKSSGHTASDEATPRTGNLAETAALWNWQFAKVFRAEYDWSMTSTDTEKSHANSLTAGEKLLAIYEESGFRVHTGWNSHHLDDWRDAPFTYVKKDGCRLNTGGGGVSWQEIPCFELLSRCFSPERVLVIGNSFGWSTLLMSLVWPEARVVAMDVGVQAPAHPAQRMVARLLRALRGDAPRSTPNRLTGSN